MELITIDFETYYDSDYSLSKMSTEAYIRSPNFEVIGAGIKKGKHETVWYQGQREVYQALEDIDFSNAAVLAHNCVFDGAILSWVYDKHPRLWLDTLSMSRPLVGPTVGGSLASLAKHYGLGVKGDEIQHTRGKRLEDFTPEELHRFGQYCINDVDLTYDLFHVLRKVFPAHEIVSVDQAIRMYTEPVLRFDRPLLTEYLEKVLASKEKLLSKIGVDQKWLTSNDRFAKLLEVLGVDPPTKISPTTGRQTWAFAKTDRGLTDLLDHPDPKVQAVVSARLGVKSTIAETRAQSFIDVSFRGPVPIMLKYYGAHTGRFSGADGTNFQNLPSRGGDNALRRSLKAPDGHVIVASDSSQIEARILAFFAGESDLVEAFRQGRDVYSEFATEVYDRTITRADGEERFVGKTAVLSLGYGSGAKTFMNMLRVQGGVHVDLDEATRIVQLYRNKHPRITALWRRLTRALNDMCMGADGEVGGLVSYDHEGILLPGGLRIQYPLLHRQDNDYLFCDNIGAYRKIMAARRRGDEGDIPDNLWKRLWGGFVAENIVQALAAKVIREQMRQVSMGFPHYRVVLQVHDEIVLLVKESDVDNATRDIHRIMSTPPEWGLGLPVACEVSVGPNYGDLTEVKF